MNHINSAQDSIYTYHTRTIFVPLELNEAAAEVPMAFSLYRWC